MPHLAYTFYETLDWIFHEDGCSKIMVDINDNESLLCIICNSLLGIGNACHVSPSTQ